jgi:hypothetical protein
MRPTAAIFLSLVLVLAHHAAAQGSGRAQSRRAAGGDGQAASAPSRAAGQAKAAAAAKSAPEVYITPHSTTVPPEAPGVAIYTTVYPATANILTGAHNPRLDCLKPDHTGHFDPEKVDEMCAYLVARGVQRVVFDWEVGPGGIADTPENRQAYLRIVWRMKDRGLAVSIYGAEPAVDAFYVSQNTSGEVHVVCYQVGKTYEEWAAFADERLAAARAAHRGKRIFVWVTPHTTLEGGMPGPDVPATLFTRQLQWARQRRVDGVVVWSANATTDTGALLPFDEKREWWAVVKRFAAATTKSAAD